MTVLFPISVQLVTEEDAELTLLTATISPSQALRAAPPVVGAPKGVDVPATTCAVTLPLVQISSPEVPTPLLLYHTVSNLQLTGQQTDITVFVTLGGIVVASHTVTPATVRAADFSVTVNASAIDHTDDIDPSQTELTIIQAGTIVQEAVPGPDRPFSTTLDNAVGMSADRRAAFQEAVFKGVKARNFKIRKNTIPMDNSTKLSDVRAAVQRLARRRTV